MRGLHVFGIAGLLIATAFSLSHAENFTVSHPDDPKASPERDQMMVWEYHVVSTENVIPRDGFYEPRDGSPPHRYMYRDGKNGWVSSQHKFQANLDDFGQYGWELCGVTDEKLIFKRIKQ